MSKQNYLEQELKSIIIKENNFIKSEEEEDESIDKIIAVLPGSNKLKEQLSDIEKDDRLIELEKEIKRIFKDDNDAKVMALDKVRYEKIMHVDKKLYGLFYSDYVNDDEIDEMEFMSIEKFKEDIRSLISDYKRVGISYEVRTFSPLSFEYFLRIDMKKGTNGMISSGTCAHCTMNIKKEKFNEFLKQKEGILGNLSKMRMILDSKNYRIFEIDNSLE